MPSAGSEGRVPKTLWARLRVLWQQTWRWHVVKGRVPVDMQFHDRTHEHPEARPVHEALEEARKAFDRAVQGED